MANKRKTTTAIVAGVTAAALLLGGTFAWTSISQQAKNESAGIVNVGGRLHDDFDGTNKDVYVENFTDPLNGGQPIYARIKLTEYMEVGQDAGGFGQDTNGDGKVTAVPVVNNTDINDKDNWSVHIPAGYCEICTNGDTCLIHDHWTWEMGGSTIFMPTFNKDKDSLAADINGTYHGTDDTDKVYYDDYVVYTTDGTTGGNDIAEADKEAYDGEIYSVIGTEYYDDDTDAADNNGTRPVENVTHTAKSTADGTVILMSAWNGTPGNYWVYDEDGWAYWANPIMPGEATGLLLDSIKMEKNPGEKCYYAINVVGQFATVGDWEYFTDSTPSEAAKELLEIVSKNVATVVVTNESGTATVEAGDTVNFSASVSLASDAATYAAGDFKWFVLNKDLTENTTSQIVENADGTATLTIGASEAGKKLIVVAKSTGDQYLGALGMSSVAVKSRQYTETEMNIINQIAAAEVVKGKELADEGANSDKVTIDGKQYFVVIRDENDETKRALLMMDVNYASPDIPLLKFGTTNSWGESDVYKYLNTTEETFTGNVGIEITKEDSETKTLTSFLTENPTVASLAMDTVIKTRNYSAENTYTWDETNSKVFVLSEADLFGNVNRNDVHPTAYPEDYTYVEDGVGVNLFEGKNLFYEYVLCWLRSTDAGYDYWDRVATIAVDYDSYVGSGYVRYGSDPQGGSVIQNWDDYNYYWGYATPCFWVDISSAGIYQ